MNFVFEWMPVFLAGISLMTVGFECLPQSVQQKFGDPFLFVRGVNFYIGPVMAAIILAVGTPFEGWTKPRLCLIVTCVLCQSLIWIWMWWGYQHERRYLYERGP